MTDRVRPATRPQPMVAVRDVAASSRWYQDVLGLVSGHGGAEYEQLLSDGQLVMQLHLLTCGHHHGLIGDPDLPLGNGVALWFESDDVDAVARRAERADVTVDTGLHRNPNSGNREIWLRDPDGYLVVVAGR